MTKAETIMNHLLNLLELVLNETTFDMGHREGNSVTYRRRPEEQLQPNCLGSIFRENKCTNRLFVARRTKVVCPPQLFSEMKDMLRNEFSEHVDLDTDSIGHVLPICKGQGSVSTIDQMLTDTRQVSSLTDFAEGLIKASTVVGSDRIVAWLNGWKDGAAVAFHTSMLLKGLRVSRILKPMDGVCVRPLARSSDQLPADLPTSKADSLEEFLDRSVLSVASLARPGLFHPSDLHDRAIANVSHVTTIDVDAVCQALALEYDTCVVQGWQWNHYPELPGLPETGSTVFQHTGLNVSSSSEPYRNRGWQWNSRGVALTGESEPIPEIDEERLRANVAALQSADDHVRVAAERWMKSKADGYPHDPHIDMRIALEALYLTDTGDGRDRGELRFRVALRGAWHLGDNPVKRHEIFATLQNAYDRGSIIVHTGRSKKTSKRKSKQQDRNVGHPVDPEASEHCRQGILKRLAKEKEPDWRKLILGFPEDSA